MTKPTQAQIMREALEEIAQDPTGISIAQAEIAKAALTAAAEVGEIAPGVKDPATIGYAYHLEKLDNAIAATIERCAQVNVPSQSRFNIRADDAYVTGYWDGVRDKEAAIRALKDEP